MGNSNKTLLVPITNEELDNEWTGQYRRSLYTTIYKGSLYTEIWINSGDKIIIDICSNIESKVKVVKTSGHLNQYRLTKKLRGSESYDFDTRSFLDAVLSLNSDSLKTDTVIPRKGMYRSINSLSDTKEVSIGYVLLGHNIRDLHSFINEYKNILSFDDENILKVERTLENLNKNDEEKRKDLPCDFCGRFADKGHNLIDFHDDFYNVHYEKKGNFCNGCFSDAYENRDKHIDLYVQKHNDRFTFNFW